MSALSQRGETGPSVKLPGPGEDASPFLLRCHVKAGSFRPLQEFEMRPLHDEFKLYVWRSATLRDIASLLHMRDPSLSSVTSLHTFRIVFYDSKRGVYAARDAGRGVTRLSHNQLDSLLEDIVSKEDLDEGEHNELFRKTVIQVRPHMPAEADEESSRRTLEDLNWNDGDVLDCVIKSNPMLTQQRRIRGSSSLYQRHDQSASSRSNIVRPSVGHYVPPARHD